MNPNDCGGCQGQGAHRRWCRETVGLMASIRGRQAEQAEALGDNVGHPEIASLLWAAAAMLREQAESLSTAR